MLYEVMKCAFISFLPHPVNNTSIIGNMWRNQQGEPVFKSTQNGWINVWLKFLTVFKFKQRIDMGNQRQNVIGCKRCSKYNDLIVVHRGVDLYTFGWALGPPMMRSPPPNFCTSWSAPPMQNLAFGFCALTRTQFLGYWTIQACD